MSKPIPDGYHTITPIIVFKDSRKAIEFYQKAFGAQERFAMPGPDGKGIMHAEVKIGNSLVMMSDENPQQPCKSAESLGKSPVSFYLYFEDVDTAFKQAVAAGGVARMPVADMFWGDRMGCVQDPFGYTWMLATHTRDLSSDQIAQGAKAAMAAKK